jgi:hypothetical protein
MRITAKFVLRLYDGLGLLSGPKMSAILSIRLFVFNFSEVIGHLLREIGLLKPRQQAL